MRAQMRRLAPQPLIAIGSGTCGLLLLGQAWTGQAQHAPSLSGAVLAAGLVVALVLTYEFPVHLAPNVKVMMGTVPLYLIATLLPPPLAVVASGVGIAVGNTMVRSRHGLPAVHILTDGSRWMIVAFAGTTVAHLGPLDHPLQALPLVAAGVVMWGGEILTGPLLLYAPTRERPLRIMRMMLREGGLVEAAQYLVGLLGALATAEAVWAPLVLLVPVVLVYITTKNTREMQESTRQVLERMADAVDLRDPYTGGHSRRVAEYTAGILRELPMRGPEYDLIVSSARVHDIGKIAIPDAVLKKDGRLTDEEFEIIKTHPDRGADLLLRYPDFARGVGIIRHHHERWDGLGYPRGLAGRDIPLGARVIAVADSFDAMTSDRPYRKGMPWSKAARIMREGSGTQREPGIVEAFLRSIADRLTEPAPEEIRLQAS